MVVCIVHRLFDITIVCSIQHGVWVASVCVCVLLWVKPLVHDSNGSRGVHHRGNDARCVTEISRGEKKSLEILYDVMQQPVVL